jgi:hypothetical protein
MNPQRRMLIKLGTMGSVLAPLGTLRASGLPASIKSLPITDNLARPLFASGSWLLADTALTVFDGEGLYLYPSWGQPRAYHITRTPAQGMLVNLEFRNPASGELLWTQSLRGEMKFAGKVCGHVEDAGTLAGLHLAPLNVPPSHAATAV